MSSPSNPPPPKHQNDLIDRSVKRRSVSGTLTFIGLRALDLPLQHQLLSGQWSLGLLARLGLQPCIEALPTANAVANRSAAAARLGLSDPALLLLLMAAGSTLKQAYWITAICNEEFRPKPAVVISFFNSAFNCINSLMLVAAATSAAAAQTTTTVAGLPLPMAVGAVAYAVGMFLETASEIQRRSFKRNPANKGRVCDQGLWALARHINYGGYALWRAGYSLAAGGWAWGAASFAFNLASFIGSSIPEIGGYMEKRYGEQWAVYRNKTKWALLPGIY